METETAIAPTEPAKAPALATAVEEMYADFARDGATPDELAVAKRDLAAVHAKREALEHRIFLLDGKAIDPDLLEEVARGVLLEARPDEVAVPREKR